MLQNAVLITGAGQRVGFHLAKAFLAQAQYPVVFTYRTPRPEVEALKLLGAIGFQVDFNDDVSFEHFLAVLHEEVASLRLLVHNASLWVKEESIQDASFDAMMAVHVKRPYQLNVSCENLLKACSERADVISITDVSYKKGNAEQIAYLASKAALSNMNKSFAQKFAPEVKVNEILPGLLMFNEGDDDLYKQKRLERMAIPVEPGAEIVWRSIQMIMSLPNTTGCEFPLYEV